MNFKGRTRKRAVSLGFAIAALPFLGLAQSVEPLARALPPDYVLNAVLRSDLSSTHSKVGDRVELEVTGSSALGGQPDYLPLRTRLIGKVTQVQRASKGQRAAIAIRVTEAQLKEASAQIDGKFGYFSVLLKQQYTDVGMLERGPGRYNGSSPVLPESTGWIATDGSIEPDETYGSVFYSKTNFMLPKGETRLTVIGFDQGQGDRAITGLVYDASRVPVSGASVILSTDKIGRWRATTGPDGSYAFYHLSPKNKYQIYARYKDQESTQQTLQPIFFEAVHKVKIDLQFRNQK